MGCDAKLAMHLHYSLKGGFMQADYVSHPKKFRISDIYFEVLALGPISDEQAERIAMRFFSGRKFKKSDKGKLFQVITLFDRQSANML